MRIVVTGAAGTLGQQLIPRLRDGGHDPIAVDIRQGEVDADWRLVDIRNAPRVNEAIDGADVVVHTAALHGIHLRNHPPRDFYDLNLTGTYNVWEAAVKVGVRGVVFSSTMGVYGESRTPPASDRVAWLDETRPLLPGDIYGWTKVAGEELCRYHLREDRVPSIALRYVMFVPEPFFRYGIRLLYGGVHEVDVADAVMAAIRALERNEVGHEAFNVEAPLPFTPADAPDLRSDPLVAVDRHFPGAAELLRERGVRSLKPVTEIFPAGGLERGLGFRPQHDFGTWLDELRSRPDERSETDPPWP